MTVAHEHHAAPAPAPAPDPASAAAGRGWRDLRGLLHLIGPDRRRFAAAVACGILNQASLIAAAALGAYLVGLVLRGSGRPDLTPVALALILLAVPRCVLPWLETLWAHDVAFRTLARVRGEVHETFARLAPGGLILRRSGDLSSRAIGDVEALELFFAHTLSPLLVALVVPSAALLVVAVVAPWLLLLIAPLLVLLAAAPRRWTASAEADGVAIREGLSEVTVAVTDSIQGAREIALFDAAAWRRTQLAQAGARLVRAHHSHAARAGRHAGLVDAITGFGVLAALALAGALVRAGDLPGEHLPVVVVTVAFALAPVSTVVEVTRELNTSVAAAGRIVDLLALPAPVTDLVTTDPEPVAAAPALEYRDVRFAYPLTGAATAISPDGQARVAPGRDVVHRISFRVGAEQMVALVGRSGSGKSTLAALAVRFFDADHGAVLVAGHDVRNWTTNGLRNHITYVPQDPYLLTGTIAANLRLGRPDATEEQILAAADAAQVTRFVTELPTAFDTLVGERGLSLSGGQRQRIALARALLRDSPLLILDEATSALDAATETLVLDGIRRFRAGRATLVIAHRLSTVADADMIAVLDAGHVVEAGTHTSLFQRQGVYHQLAAVQLDGLPTDRGDSP
ncbi:ABC transporter ATP-binding protein [Parafrankia sp. FMc2]|uniref:ABC transporter ATP-binding protein n=1 Tax=Parafrankia sp. FMc2 TaxID=3233196 RepID=UPI0034D42D3F